MNFELTHHGNKVIIKTTNGNKVMEFDSPVEYVSPGPMVILLKIESSTTTNVLCCNFAGKTIWRINDPAGLYQRSDGNLCFTGAGFVDGKLKAYDGSYVYDVDEKTGALISKAFQK